MEWSILAIVLFSITSFTLAARDEQCRTGGTASTIPDATNYHTYTETMCANPTHFECLDGECRVIADICDTGVTTNDCTTGEDQLKCGSASCASCTADQPTGTNTQGRLVSWTPPTLATADIEYRVISDPNHFPSTTFDVGSTDVVYRIFGPVPYHICQFVIVVDAAVKDHCLITCPNTNQIVMADSGETTQTATWTEPSTPLSAPNTINVEAYRPGSSFPIGYTRVVYTFTDTVTNPPDPDCFCAFYVIVKANPDDVGPTIECPLEPIVKTLYPPATSTTVTEELEELLNSVDDSVSSTTSRDLDSDFLVGTTPFVVTLVDAHGNSHSCSADVTIQRPFDDVPPVISNCPASGVTVCYKTGGDGVVKASWNAPTASDNILLTDFLPNIDPNNFLQIPTVAPYSYPVTYTATDWNDNEATCVFTLTFEADVLPPVITNCNNHTEYTAVTSGMIEVTYPEPDISDNCDQYEVTIDPVGKMFAVPSTQRITYTVSDIAGTETMCSFTVEVKVDQDPQFEDCPESLTFTTDTDTTSAEVQWSAPKITDDNQLNPDNVKLTFTPGLPGVVLEAKDDQKFTLEIGTYTVEYSYADVNLQNGVCVFTITVQDKEPPTFKTCPSAMERTLDALDDTIVVEWDRPTAVDNDGEDVTVEIQNNQYEPGSKFQTGQYTIVYTATDQANNEGLCSFLLTVNAYDTSNFWIDCPGNIEEETDPGVATASVEWDPPEPRADVHGFRFSNTHSPGSRFVIGDTQVSYILFDRADNSEVCSFVVKVVDKEPPVIISCPGGITVYGLQGRNTVPVFWPEPRTSDNSGSTVSLNASPSGAGTEFGYGTSQVYYSAVDASGNSISGCHFQITVVQPGETSVISGSARFSVVRGSSSSGAVAQRSNLADDMDKLFRQNTAISSILAGVQVGTPSPLSGGYVFVPFTLYFAKCRAAFLHVRDSLIQNLQGNNRDSFDTNNVIDSYSFQLDTREFLISQLIVDEDLELPDGQQTLTYNGDYSNPRTTVYQNYEERVCGTLDQLYSAFTGYCGCALWKLSSGSINTDAILIFNGDSSVSQSALYDQIGNSIVGDNLNNLILEFFDQTTVTEVCPETYCQNGGTCEPNAATYESQCRCPTDYTGSRCETFSGPDTNPTEDPGSNDPILTTEEIIGIVVGAVGGLLLLIILLACFCVFCLRPSEPKPQPIIQEPPEPIFSVQPPPRQKVLVRDVLEPPPIPRPYPVRVPDRFPVPIPHPVPVPVARPVLRPFPVPIRQPVPFPVRVPVPIRHAVPRPVPIPIRQAVPVPNPIAIPRPVPVPVQIPVPVVQHFPIPVREQVPVMQPIGVPVPSRLPFGPAGLGNGFGSRLGPDLSGFNGGLNSGFGLNGGIGLNSGFNGGFDNGLNRVNGFNNTGF